MPPNTLKIIGIACGIGFVICLFIAVERYQSNAANVRAIANDPMSRMLMPEGAKLEPATPTATKYAIFIGFILLACSIASFTTLIRQHSAKPKTRRLRRARSATTTSTIDGDDEDPLSALAHATDQPKDA